MTSPSTASGTSLALGQFTGGMLGTGGSVFAGSTSSGLISISTMGQMVTVKLNRDNHLLWKAQVVPILRGHQVLGYVDGSYPAPPKSVRESDADGAPMVDNVAYTAWYTQDQLILSALLSTLSPEVLARTLGLASSAAVWSAIERMFSSHSRTKVTHIRRQLALIQKDMSMADYYGRVKALGDQLAAIGSALSDDEMTTYLLTGLDQSYESFTTSINLQGGNMPLDELYSHMLDYEALWEAANTSYQITANAAARGNGGANRGRGRGNGGRGGYANQGGRGGPPNHGGNGGNPGGQGARRNAPGNRPTCQICGTVRHSAFKCYNRFDASYQGEELLRFTNHANTGHQAFDPAWYVDSGATDHITGDLEKLNVREIYSGKEQVHAANGSGMKISHIGDSHIHMPHNQSLVLKNVLLVPQTQKSLLSAHRLTNDNNVSIELFPNGFVVKDLATRKVLAHGASEDGLYPVLGRRPSQHRTALSISVKPSYSRWHCRLGHSSSVIVDHVLNRFDLPYGDKQNKTSICDACQQGKSHQLPFSRSNRVSSVPSELVFSDVWGPACLSSGGFKYYVSFVDDFSKFTLLFCLRNKKDVEQVFLQWQAHVERLLNRKVLQVQSD